LLRNCAFLGAGYAVYGLNPLVAGTMSAVTNCAMDTGATYDYYVRGSGNAWANYGSDHNDIYASFGNSYHWDQVGDRTLTQWQSDTNSEKTSITTQPQWVNGNADMGTYYASIGGTNDEWAFLSYLRARPRRTWDSSYDIAAIVAYYMAQYTPTNLPAQDTANPWGYYGAVDYRTPTAPALQSIAVTPAAATAPMGGNQQFAAQGGYSDGTYSDVTASATWTSSNTACATINSGVGGGLATPVAPGTTSIQAAVGTVSSNTAALTVSAAAPPSLRLSGSIAPATVPVGTPAVLTLKVNVSGTPPAANATLTLTLPVGTVIAASTDTGSLTCTAAYTTDPAGRTPQVIVSMPTILAQVNISVTFNPASMGSQQIAAAIVWDTGVNSRSYPVTVYGPTTQWAHR
jgi:hypothetical protein